MSIHSITGTGRVLPAATGMPAPAPPTSIRTSATEPEVDAVTQQPIPPRFPWLSRLTQQLEQAARQHPAFNEAPILGENLDRSA